MKISKGMVENGTVVGNSYDKYGSRNPVVRRLMAGFEQALSGFVDQVSPRTIHEVGCGEGYWVMRWADQGIVATGSDFSSKVIELARSNAAARGLPAGLFSVQSLYDQPDLPEIDLIVCCEVLEHLDDPAAALARLRSAARGHVILSVPREPVWSVLNLVRGKYVTSLGNTPGHVQRWSSATFRALVSEYFDIIDTRTPLPWTMLLCRARP